MKTINEAESTLESLQRRVRELETRRRQYALAIADAAMSGDAGDPAIQAVHLAATVTDAWLAKLRPMMDRAQRQAEATHESASRAEMKSKRKAWDEARRVAAEARADAVTWFRARQEQLKSTLPMRREPAIAAARADGVDVDALMSIVTTVTRRGRPEEGEFLALPHEFLQRDWMPSAEPSPAA